MQTIKDVQSKQQGGHTKLTAVSIYAHGKKHNFFAMLHHNQKGEAILPQAILDKELDKARVRRGDTYSVGY